MAGFQVVAVVVSMRVVELAVQVPQVWLWSITKG
jgi:hypothetical protein